MVNAFVCRTAAEDFRKEQPDTPTSAEKEKIMGTSPTRTNVWQSTFNPRWCIQRTMCLGLRSCILSVTWPCTIGHHQGALGVLLGIFLQY